MNKSAFKYIVIISLLILSSCTSKTYEWVKINPDKIAVAKAAIPYSENVRHVNVKVNAKHKAENITYVENSLDYFAKPVFENKETVRTTSRRIVKRKKPNSLNSKPEIAKVISKPIVRSAPKKQVLDSEVSMSKLNNALIIPKKKKAKETSKENRTTTNSEKLPVNTAPAKEKEIIQVAEPAKNDKENKEEALGYDNGLNQLEDLDKELNKNELKTVEDQSIAENQIKEESSKRNSYMWVGLVLLIIGLIIGLIFGGMAYLISVVGIVFLLIGYFTKI